VRLADASLRTMSDARQRYPDFDITRSWAFPPATPAPLPQDEPLSAYLRRIGFTEAQLTYANRSYANASGAPIDALSALGAAEDWTDDRAGTGDYRILDGYNRLHELLSAGVDVRLNTQVMEIHWSDRGVRVVTSDGQTFEAERAILTLPLGVLQARRVRFEPALPADKQAAIDALCMEPALKMVYRFPQPVTPLNTAAIYSPHNPPMWWTPSFGHGDVPRPVWTAFATGNWARELLAMGESGALARGLAVLRGELRDIPGANADAQPEAMQLVNWAADPFALGGYSAIPVGALAARRALAQPTGRALYWAGEAAADGQAGGTVHGAYWSGLRAAQDIMSSQYYRSNH
jgi:monoamine oxidase